MLVEKVDAGFVIKKQLPAGSIPLELRQLPTTLEDTVRKRESPQSSVANPWPFVLKMVEVVI